MKPTLTYHAEVTEGKIKMPDTMRAKMLAEVTKDYEGKQVTLTVKAKRKPRSNAQNAYYWSVVIPLVLEAMIDLGNVLQSGNEDHANMIHDLLKREHLDNGPEVYDATGTLHKLPSSTKRCDTAAFMDYISKIQSWAAEFLNINIPDPNEQVELPI